MLTIRQVQPADFEEIVRIESLNFPPEEAASREAMAERIDKTADSFFVAELDERLVGYIEGPVLTEGIYITDDLFHKVRPNPLKGGYLAVTSLSVLSDFKGQGVGSALLAAFKDLAVAQERRGISLTCHEELISYYEMNGFSSHGLSESSHGGSVWYNLIWEVPSFDDLS